MKIKVDVGVREFDVYDKSIDRFALRESRVVGHMWGTLMAVNTLLFSALIAIDNEEYEKGIKSIVECIRINRAALDEASEANK